MNKKTKEEEEEEEEEQDHTSISFDQPDDQYSQEDDDEEEVDVSNMAPITSETINRIRRSSSQIEKSRIIVDSTENCLPSRSSSTLTNTESSPSSTKFTIDEILKPDFGICKIRRDRHHRPLQQDLSLLSFQHRPQVISFGPTGSVIIPMSHYATSLYSSTSSLAPPPIPSTLPPPPVIVPSSGSFSSLSSSSPLLSSSSSSSSSLVRYGSDSISPASLGLHPHLQNHHHKPLSSSSTTIHTFKQTRQHHNHQRLHQHSQSHGSLGSYHQNSSNHSHRNHHHFQHPQNRSENSTNQQHVHVSRSQQHHSQQNQHHSSSVQKPEQQNHHRSNRDTFSGKPLHFLNPSGTVSDFTEKERDSDICNSPPATSLMTTTKNNSNTLKNKKTNINNTISGDPNISSNQPSTNSQTTTATVYEGTAPFVWPAWVYCTRYSDRPSSGKTFYVCTFLSKTIFAKGREERGQ